MTSPLRQLRTPEERVGMLPNASLPPPPVRGTASVEDQLLLRALRNRDEAAFSQVLDDHFPGMLRIALGYVSNTAIAEEVVQDTWVAAIEGIGRFEGRSSVKTWLYHILRNIARTRGKREDRLRPLSALLSPDAAAAGVDPLSQIVGGRVEAKGSTPEALWAGRTPTPEEQLLSDELRERIEAALVKLPSRQREVIVLRDVEGWSAADVCNTLGLSDTNQRVLLHRARERVRHELRQYVGEGDLCNDDQNDYLP